MRGERSTMMAAKVRRLLAVTNKGNYVLESLGVEKGMK
jgi:hypothetical protein